MIHLKRQAMYFLDRGVFGWAISPLLQYLTFEPDDIHAMTVLLRVVRETEGNGDPASNCIELLEHARYRVNPVTLTNFLQAEEFQLEGKAEIAIERYELAMNAGFRNHVVTTGRAKALAEAGMDAEALDAFSEVVKNEPSYMPAIVGYFDHAFEIGRFDILEDTVKYLDVMVGEAAMRYYVKPASIVGNLRKMVWASSKTRSSIALHRQGKMIRARDLIIDVFREFPQNYPILSILTSLCSDQVALDPDENLVSRSLRSSPDVHGYVRSRGLSQNNDFEKAWSSLIDEDGEKTLRQRLNSDSDDIDAEPARSESVYRLIEKGRTQEALGNTELSEAYYELALKKAPWSAQVRYSLASRLYENNDVERSLSVVENLPITIDRLKKYDYDVCTYLKNLDILRIRALVKLGYGDRAEKKISVLPLVNDEDKLARQLLMCMVNVQQGNHGDAEALFLKLADNPEGLAKCVRISDTQYLKDGSSQFSNLYIRHVTLIEGVARAYAGEFEKSLELIESYLKKESRNAFALSHAARISIFLNKRWKARWYLRKIKDVDSLTGEVRKNIMDTIARLGNLNKLLLIPKTLKEKEWVLQWGFRNKTSRRQREVLFEWCEEVFAENPDSRSLAIARCLLSAEAGTQTSDELKNLVRVDSLSVALRNDLARLLFEENKPVEAGNVIEEIRKYGDGALVFALRYAAFAIAAHLEDCAFPKTKETLDQ